MYEFQNQATQKKSIQLKSANNIVVAVRTRPFNHKELQFSDYQTVKILNSKVIALLDPEIQYVPEDIFRKNRNKQIQYEFDYTFDKFIDNKFIYSKTTSFLIQEVIDGFNATVFTYGATGCGKTFTMIGTNQHPGIMPLSMANLFQKVQSCRISKQVEIKVSYLEIYNQSIIDLLISDNKNLELREDPKLGVSISGITEVPVHNILQIYSILKMGNKNRSKENTGANEASSRSHGILQVTIFTKQKNEGLNTEIRVSKLSLVDLAGSERASNTTNKGIKMMQGAKINQSLLTLGNCIQALSDMNQKGIKKSFVPYRGSKMTRLLKDSLGGNCRTVMIANISPALSAFQDTYNTLMYASRAKNIKTNAQRNVSIIDNHVSNYSNIITQLKKQNEDLKNLYNKNQNEIKIKMTFGSNEVGIIQPNQNIFINKIQTSINNHFKQQLIILKKLYENSEQVENISFNVSKLMIQLQKEKQFNKQGKENEFTKQKIQNSKALIEAFSKKKEQIQKQLNKKIQKRNNMINQIKSSDLPTLNKNYLLTLIKQHQIAFQKEQVIYKQKKIQNESSQKEILINYLRNQLSLRDKIIEQQKIIIDKNNIANTITYSKLKNLNQISNQEKFIFPFFVQKGRSLPPLKKQAARKEIQKAQLIDKMDYEQLQTPSLSKKKKQIKLNLQKSPMSNMNNRSNNYHVNIENLLKRYKLQKSQKFLQNVSQKNSPRKKKRQITYLYPQYLERKHSLPDTENIKKREISRNYDYRDRYQKYEGLQSPQRSLILMSHKKKQDMAKLDLFQAKYDQLMAKVNGR